MSILKDLQKGSFISFILGALNKLIGFGLQYLLVHWISSEGYGFYTYTLSIIAILAPLSLLGLRTYVLRFVSSNVVQSKWAEAKGNIFISNLLAIISSVFVIIVAELIIGSFKNIEIGQKNILQIGMVLILFINLSIIREETLRALKHIFASRFLEMLLMPVIMIIGILVLSYLEINDPLAAIILRAVAIFIIFIIGAIIVRHFLPVDIKHVRSRKYDLKVLFSVSLPMLFAGSMRIVTAKTDIIMLGHLNTMEGVGVYNVCSNIARFAVFGLIAINSIAAPLISRTYIKGEHVQLQRVVSLSVFGSGTFGLLISIGIVIFGRKVLGIFGAEFLKGFYPLLVLTAGHFINSAFGPVGFMLTMTGYQNFLAFVLFVSAALNISLNFILIPYIGLLGASVSSMISMVMRFGMEEKRARSI
ncbi:hypothetical protein ES705_08627 [subsurface metagenome]